MRRVVVVCLLVTVSACDPIRTVAVTVRSVPALGPIGEPRRLPGAQIREICPDGGAGWTLGTTDEHGEVDRHALGTHDVRCSLAARAAGHYDQSVRIGDAQGGRRGRHFLAVQFDLVSQDSRALPPPAAPAPGRTVPVSFTSALDGIEVRTLDHRRLGGTLTAEPRVCVTPACVAVRVPVGKPIVVARGGDAATLAAPVLIDRASTVDIRYVDHRRARWARGALGVVALAGLTALLVGIQAERTDVTLAGTGVFAVSLTTGLMLPWWDEAALDVRPQ